MPFDLRPPYEDRLQLCLAPADDDERPVLVSLEEAARALISARCCLLARGMVLTWTRWYGGISGASAARPAREGTSAFRASSSACFASAFLLGEKKRDNWTQKLVRG